MAVTDCLFEEKKRAQKGVKSATRSARSYNVYYNVYNMFSHVTRFQSRVAGSISMARVAKAKVKSPVLKARW